MTDIIDEDGERVTDERFCAFTDDNGNGPDAVYLTQSKAWDDFIKTANLTERKLMLGIDRDPSDDPASGFAPGCLTMTAATVTWLRDQLTAWLDAPRLAARKTPTVVAEHNGCRLLTTSAGEWGIADDDESTAWLTCESEARYEFRNSTGTVSCESCARFIDRGDAECDDDGIYACADETACSAAIAAKESAK